MNWRIVFRRTLPAIAAFSVMLVAPTAVTAQSGTEVLSLTATTMGMTPGSSRPLRIDLSRWSTDAERSTLLYRSDQYKSKLLAANITRLFIVVATEPSFADDLVSRALVACEAAGVEAHLITGKVNLRVISLHVFVNGLETMRRVSQIGRAHV